MKEQRAIVDAYRKVDFSQRKTALATVVKVRGSSYRSPGARMLITDDGKWTGSISGGCLEGDALRKARQVMNDKKPVTVTYDTREESNQNLGIGLGCNGVIDVLIEPVDPLDKNNPIMLFEQFLNLKGPIAVATVFSGLLTGEKIILTEQKQFYTKSSNEILDQLVARDLEKVFNEKTLESKKYSLQNETVEVFIELIQPTISLIIFGGGFDARPVSQLAKSIGWNVTVTDECVAHIAPVFFPDADKLSLCQREFIDRDFEVTPYSACVLMSHNYDYDRDVLKKLLTTDTPYIGILGPRKRFNKMSEELLAMGVIIEKEDSHRIHSPIGLDIGAETPDEIAVSIIAEIQGKFANRTGGFLKYRNAPIHHRDLKSDQVFKQVYIAPEKNNKSAHG
jgi:xanthine dehydrogenase accessory factor